MVANIGFYICFFRFDVTDYTSGSDAFRNFSPLNPRNWTEEDLNYLDIFPVLESINGRDVIQAIPLNIGNENHQAYIEEMFL